MNNDVAPRGLLVDVSERPGGAVDPISSDDALMPAEHFADGGERSQEAPRAVSRARGAEISNLGFGVAPRLLSPLQFHRSPGATLICSNRIARIDVKGSFRSSQANSIIDLIQSLGRAT